MVCLVLLKDLNQGARNPTPWLRATACGCTLSFIRTVTVGPGIAPGLLTSW
jgi:hypothetical protein